MARFTAAAVLLAVSLGASTLRAQDATEPLRTHGCVGCHSLDGAQNQGPTFQGLAGSSRGVLRDGERVTVVADEAYLRRAIETPNAEIADGFDPGFMPTFDLEGAEVDALVTAVQAVPADGAPTSPGTWIPLALGLVLFVLGHLALSSAPLRGPLVARMGEAKFQGLYSLVAAVGLGLIVWGYLLAPYVILFEPPTWTRWIPNVVVPLAYVLLVLGFTTPSPTIAGMADKAAEGPKGIQRITRHPALWGFALWGLAHIPPNGDLRSTLVFVSIAFLGLAGMVHIDLRRAATGSEAWERYEQQTSVFPFVAIVAGRQKLALGELGWWRILIGVLAWAAMLHLHRWLIGVSPLP